MSDSVTSCSDMIVFMLWDTKLVPMPLRFWKVILRVFGGFSFGSLSPIQELGGYIWFCCVVCLSFMS